MVSIGTAACLASASEPACSGRGRDRCMAAPAPATIVPRLIASSGWRQTAGRSAMRTASPSAPAAGRGRNRPGHPPAGTLSAWSCFPGPAYAAPVRGPFGLARAGPPTGNPASNSPDRLAAVTMAAPSSSMVVSSIPPSGHSTANSMASAGGSGHSHNPQPVEPEPRPRWPLLPGHRTAWARAAGPHRPAPCDAGRPWWPWCRRRSARRAAAACPAAVRRRALRTPRAARMCTGPTSRLRTGRPAWTPPRRPACIRAGTPGSWAAGPPRSRCGQLSAQWEAPCRFPGRADPTRAGVPVLRRGLALHRPAKARRTSLHGTPPERPDWRLL